MAAAVSSVPAAEAPVSHKQVLIVFSGLVLVMLLASLDGTIVSTALPTIVGELGGLERLSWVVTSYLLAQTVVTPLYGKLGDLYGRKVVLQAAIVLFLVGSALCGLSRSMTELIVFRALQGLGGGGLMVTTQAVVGDIVPPRDRGRYQGIFGAVFGVASVAGPLLGGYFTTHLSWRWIFYVNLPLGVLALAVLAVTLPAHSDRVRHAIDYAGAATLAVALSAIILLCDLGGTALAWTSPWMLALITALVISLAAFISVESRAAEPIMPLRLFKEPAFTFTSAVGLIVGFALFGSVTYLPLYLQVAKGMSPTASGLQMLPQMGGTLVTSILTGQLISRFGRYKLFPIIGTGIMTVGLFLLSRITPQTDNLHAGLMMLTLGLGMGMVMQVLVIAVQNAVDYQDLGVATSGAILFRLIGGSLGTAALGAIFSSRLAVNLPHYLPSGTAPSTLSSGLNPQTLAQMSSAVREGYAAAYTASLSTVFIVATGMGLLAWVLTWLIPERPLRKTVAAVQQEVGTEMGEAFAMPTDLDSLTLLQRGLLALADNDVKRRFVEGIVRRAGLDLSPLAAWLLIRLERDPALNLETLGRTQKVELGRMEAARAELEARLLIEAGSSPAQFTDEGCAVFNRLVAARREHLTEVWREWSPQKREEFMQVLQGLARDLVPERQLSPRRSQ